jgi:tRNA A-37 threonylcarbamoyl transferase component Bud32
MWTRARLRLVAGVRHNTPRFVDCLSEETLFDLARGKLSGDRLEAAMAHVAGCADCAALLTHAAPALEGTAQGVAPPSAPEVTPVPARVPSALKIGTDVRGTYRVVRLIGRGGMGVVYEVSHARLHGRYALKLINPEFAADQAALSRFRREAQVTSSLRHPNIVQVIDFDQTDDGRPFLAMEFLDGPTLAHHLDERGPLPLPAALAIVRQIADALEAAHRAGVVHRDLKPENVVLVTQDPERFLVKLLDFGLSKMRSGSLRITGSAALLGTPTYMTPEQALGEVDKVDGRTDQYALGTLAWETLVGKPPFRGDSVHAVLYQIIHQAPPANPGLAPGVERVLRRALAKERDERYPTVAAFSEALLRAADENPSAPPVVRERGEPPRKRTTLVVGLGVAAGIGLGAVALLGPLRSRRFEEAPPMVREVITRPVAAAADAAREPPPVRVVAAPPDAAAVAVPVPPQPPPARVGRRNKRPSLPAAPVATAPAEAVVSPSEPPSLPPDAGPPPARRAEFPQPLRKL